MTFTTFSRNETRADHIKGGRPYRTNSTLDYFDVTPIGIILNTGTILSTPLRRCRRNGRDMCACAFSPHFAELAGPPPTSRPQKSCVASSENHPKDASPAANPSRKSQNIGLLVPHANCRLSLERCLPRRPPPPFIMNQCRPVVSLASFFAR